MQKWLFCTESQVKPIFAHSTKLSRPHVRRGGLTYEDGGSAGLLPCGSDGVSCYNALLVFFLQAARFQQGLPENILDVRVDAAELVVRPALYLLQQFRVDPYEKGFFDSHLTGTDFRC